MLISLIDTTGKKLHLNPQFVSAVKSRGAGCTVIYDIAGNMFYVTEDEQVDTLLTAMASCAEVVIMPDQTPVVGNLFTFDSDEDEEQDENEIEDLLTVASQAPKKRPRSKKNVT